ncbi:S-adenosyl-L-methionine-dependent tRNA 4-demethylwyosine synthase [Thoreauomyces humboldtii]|nr:S-adenosyl-L-methionine-dependent tRNA 4-demethylwyosine synthase [Thoreauomyces humboldtii]
MSVIVSTLRHPGTLAAVALALSCWLLWASRASVTPASQPLKAKLPAALETSAPSAAVPRRRRGKKEKKVDSGCCKTGENSEVKGDCCSTAKTGSEDACCKTGTSELVPGVEVPEEDRKITVKVLFGTQTKTARTLSLRVKELVEAALPSTTVEVLNIADYENEDLMSEKSPVIFILSTYSEGTPTDDAAWFYSWLEDVRFDHRVEKECMKGLRFAVFGLGDSVYEENYCTVAKRVDEYVAFLGGRRMCPLDFGDKSDDTELQFTKWTTLLLSRLLGVTNHLSVADNMEFYEGDADYESAEEEEDDEEANDSGDGLMDLEDMGAMASKIKTAKTSKLDEEESYGVERSGPKRTIGEEQRPTKITKEMVTPMLRKSLEKQGYKIVGTHSGVKMCRWTKNMLRGRGGCYKHTFYGIESHRCMETTPSLACANKCVFCWRQHTNPVGTEWRWKQDDALDIVNGTMEKHYQMVKQMRGVPGVKADRFEEAFTIKHCALSLVGEPIMYPQINDFVEILHSRNVSSFLVTNAQFPDAITALVPVTQLYVSIDAGTKEDLKAIDRPLFKDFWERFLACLDELGKKGQRTVYRLTLVKDKNDATLDQYATLIKRGSPCFIEVKGVTYCGFGAASHLTMKNVPYHHEVLKFCEGLCELLDGKYAVASVHEHSCSVLIAKKEQYFKDGEWHTWIDYDRFFELVKEGKPFTSQDYMAKSPAWAVVGQSGFDPEETRWYRNASKNPDAAAAHALVEAVER